MNSEITYLLPGVGLVLLGLLLGFAIANILWRRRQSDYKKEIEKLKKY